MVWNKKRNLGSGVRVQSSEVQGSEFRGLEVQRFRVQRFRGPGFSPAADQKNGRSNRKRNSKKANIDILRFAVPTICSFIRAPPLAASVQSDQKRNFLNVSYEGPEVQRFAA
jgi:hypothetical protein